MRGIINYLTGIRDSIWNLRYTFYLWLLSLGFTFSIYIPVKKFFFSRVGHFPDVHYLAKHPDYANYIFSRDPVLTGAIFSMFLIFYLISIIVEAGILSGIVNREDFSSWRRYFRRFFVIEILTPIFYLPYLIVGALPGIFVALSIPYHREKAFTNGIILSAIFFLLFFIVAGIGKDYAKIWVIKENRGSINSMLKAIVLSFKYWFSSLFMGILAILLWLVPYILLAGTFSSLPSILSFLAFQLLILLKAFSRISLYFAEKAIIDEVTALRR